MRQMFPAFLVALLMPFGVAAQECTIEKNRIQTGKICLVAQVIARPESDGRPLAVVVHGDGGGGVRDSYLQMFETTTERIKAAVPGAGVVFLQRPGYRSKFGQSEGSAKPEDDDYTKENVAHMAAAITALREIWKPSRLIWVGHSGGSALGALVMGMNPGLIDGAVLSACPCGDVFEWRSHRNTMRGRYNASTWPNSLSPIKFQDGLRPGTPVVLMTGDKDDNTLVKFAAAWQEAAKARGVTAELLVLPGINHPNAAGVPEVAEHAARLMR